MNYNPGGTDCQSFLIKPPRQTHEEIFKKGKEEIKLKKCFVSNIRKFLKKFRSIGVKYKTFSPQTAFFTCVKDFQNAKSDFWRRIKDCRIAASARFFLFLPPRFKIFYYNLLLILLKELLAKKRESGGQTGIFLNYNLLLILLKELLAKRAARFSFIWKTFHAFNAVKIKINVECFSTNIYNKRECFAPMNVKRIFAD
jgi:hypothetical protein